MSNNSPLFQNILLIQLRRVGDVLMTTPSIRALRKAQPQAQITFMTEAPSDQVLQHNPYLNEVWTIPRKLAVWRYFQLLRKVGQKHFDLVIDFFSNPKSGQISWMSRAPQRIGFDFLGRHWYYTNRVAPKPEAYAAENKLLLLELLGIPKDSLTLDFFITQEDHRYAAQLFQQFGIQKTDFLVSLSPVSRQPYKVWPAHRFAKIADQLIEQFGAKILFIYGPGEQHFVDEVRQGMQHKALPNYPAPTLTQTKAIFEQIDLHIGNDNGPCHCAISAGIPTVAIFGKPQAIHWTPPSPNAPPQHWAVEHDPGCKTQCTYPQCHHLNCLYGVTLEQVQQTVFQIIQQQMKRSHV